MCRTAFQALTKCRVNQFGIAKFRTALRLRGRFCLAQFILINQPK